MSLILRMDKVLQFSVGGNFSHLPPPSMGCNHCFSFSLLVVVSGILGLEGTLETVLSHSLNLQAELMILVTLPDSGLALGTEM